MNKLHAIFHGKVQGVWFRANFKKKADELGVVGWVKNLPDGTVEAIVEGERKDLEEILDWCRNDMPMAEVASVDAEWSEPSAKFYRFAILR
jgi:acylphosphatase